MLSSTPLATRSIKANSSAFRELNLITLHIKDVRAFLDKAAKLCN
jgi:hypothetical protein